MKGLGPLLLMVPAFELWAFVPTGISACPVAFLTLHGLPPWPWLSVMVTHSDLGNSHKHHNHVHERPLQASSCPGMENEWVAKSSIGRALQPQAVGVHRLDSEARAAGAT